MIKEFVLKNRSYRRFYQNEQVSKEILIELVDLARLSASLANKQPLKYIISNTEDKNAKIFPYLAWAGYLEAWLGPKQGERPAAYIIILGDKKISSSFGCDQGIASQSILLGATEKGLGGCIIGTVKQEALAKSLSIDDNFDILLVIALGKPKEQVIINQVGDNGDIKYWRDHNDVHHVPKRNLEDILLK